MNFVQLDFQQAKAKHLQFKSRLRSILYGAALTDESPVLSHYECPVGKWIYGHALSSYGQVPEVHELEKVHADIHTVARKLVQLYKDGRIDEARKGLDRMEHIADELISLLQIVEDKLSPSLALEQYDHKLKEEDLQTLHDLYQKNETLDKKIKIQSEAFVNQQDFFKSLLEASPVVLWMSNTEGIITYMNSTWYRWTGHATDQSVAEKWVYTIHPEDHDFVVSQFKEDFNARRKFQVEYRMLVDGKIKWCLTTGQPGYNSEHAFTGYVGSITDITERKNTDKILHQKTEDARQVLHDFFMQAPAIFCILRGKDHIFELANPQYQQLIGNRNVIGLPIRQALPEVEGQGFFELLDHAFQNKESFIGSELPLTIDKGNGPEDIFVTFIYQPIINSRNETDGILVYANEVTEQVVARKLLEKSETNFRMLADLSPQIIWTARSDGYLDYYNQRWYEFTGFEESYGDQSWTPILHPDDVQISINTWYAAVHTGEEYRIEYRFKDRITNEYRWFLGQALPVRNDQGKITKWFGSCTDIHEQKSFSDELEKKVEQRTQQLLELNADLKRTNEELGQFAYVASHDLQEPLRKIITFSNRITDKFNNSLPPGSEVYLKKIYTSAIRMSRLISDLLNFSSATRSNKEFIRTDLNKILKQTLVDFEVELIQKKAKIKNDPLPLLQAIPLQMSQLFHNLMSNALKFSKQDAPPEISITYRQLSKSENEQYNVPDKKQTYSEILFCDNGIGFEEKFEEQIFTIFHRLHGKLAYSGTGIGLALCKKIVENHGGNIFARSVENTGTCFHIVIPSGLNSH